MDLNNALMNIQNTAVRAGGRSVVIAKREPTDRYYLKQPDGSLRLMQAQPPHLTAKLYELAAVIQFAEHHASVDLTTNVYYGFGRVIVIPNQEDSRDFGLFELQESEEWKALRAAGSPMPQKAFITMLRTTLVDALNEHVNLLPAVRRLKAMSSSEMDADVQHGKESLGRSVNAAVQGTQDIPETVRLTVPIYTNPGETAKYPVDCALVIDPQTVTFALKPLPGRMEAALQAHNDYIGERLRKALPKTAIFYGRD